MTETYARDELERAAYETKRTGFLKQILDDLCGGMTWTSEEIMSSGSRLGYPKTASVILARAREMKSVTEIIDEIRKPAVDAAATITAGELEDWVRRNRIYVTASISAADIVRNIVSVREPEYPPGTTWRSTVTGYYYRRTAGGWWTFATSALTPFDEPERPLERMP